MSGERPNRWLPERWQAEGVDLAGYTITEVIDDAEDARIALGYERLNLLGESCGARTVDLIASKRARTC